MTLLRGGVVSIAIGVCLVPFAGCTFLVSFDDAGSSEGGPGVAQSGDATTGASESGSTNGSGEDGNSGLSTGSGTDGSATGNGTVDASNDEDGGMLDDASAPVDSGPVSDPLSCPNACSGYNSAPYWVCAKEHANWCDDDQAALDIILCNRSFDTTSKRCNLDEPCTSGGANYSDFCNPCASSKGDTGCVSNGNPSTISTSKTDIKVDCSADGVATNPRVCEPFCLNCDEPLN